VNPSTTPAREMSDTERRERFARSQALYTTAINLSGFATVFGILGVLFFWLLPVGALMLIAGLLVGRHADKVSPY
jgi:hypothetical protein